MYNCLYNLLEIYTQLENKNALKIKMHKSSVKVMFFQILFNFSLGPDFVLYIFLGPPPQC